MFRCQAGTIDQTYDHASGRKSAFLSQQGKPEDHFFSSEYVDPSAKKTDGPPRSRLLQFSSLDHSDSVWCANMRREDWYSNDRDSTAFSWAFPNENPLPSLEPFNLLFHRPITRHDMRWDLSNPWSMSGINIHQNCFSFLDGSPLGPNVFLAQIHFRESCPWRLERLWVSDHPCLPKRTWWTDHPHLLVGIVDSFQSPIEDTNHDLAMAAIRRETAGVSEITTLINLAIGIRHICMIPSFEEWISCLGFCCFESFILFRFLVNLVENLMNSFISLLFCI